MTLQAGDSRALPQQASKSRGTVAPSPGRAVGRGGGSANAQLRHKSSLSPVPHFEPHTLPGHVSLGHKGMCSVPAWLVLCLSQHRAAALVSQGT